MVAHSIPGASSMGFYVSIAATGARGSNILKGGGVRLGVPDINRFEFD